MSYLCTDTHATEKLHACEDVRQISYTCLESLRKSCHFQNGERKSWKVKEFKNNLRDGQVVKEFL